MGNSSAKPKRPRSDNRPRVTKDEFEKIANLGSGNYASVLLVKKKDTNEYYAMKVLNKQYLIAKDEVEHTKTERKILECASHPFLVKMFYAFQTTEHLYIVMSFANGGELFSHLKREKRFNENKARFYAAEIFLGLEYLHEGGVVYRDLKPENVLLDHQGHIVLTDFGLSKILNKDGKTRTFCGTPEYLAPETILNHPHGKPVDWWSFGILLYEMLVGIPPYYSNDVQDMYEKILYSDLYIPDYVSPEATDILSKLLIRPPKQRLGSKEGPSEIKNHPFFKSINWGKLMEKKIKPPYVPNLKGPDDISLVDPQFSRQRVNSFPDRAEVNQDQNHAFSGFTYEPSSPNRPTLASRTPDLKNSSTASKSSPTALPNNTPSPNTAQSRDRSPNT